MTGGVGAPRDEAGLDEAVEAAAWPIHNCWIICNHSGGLGTCEIAARGAVAAAYPIIAAAVRADVLREVEAALVALAPTPGPWQGPWVDGIRDAVTAVRALASAPAREP